MNKVNAYFVERILGRERIGFEVVTRRVDRLKYIIRGKVLSFTPLDVTLILRLMIGDLHSEPVRGEKKNDPTAFREKYIGKKNSINAADIKDALIAIKVDSEADLDDLHRLHRLYLLPNVESSIPCAPSF
ncbi:hypothetical protein FRX31_014041 [Thalictrum thalictroides]|uniref:Uncharacterized protein n=1 Tax=Thalictrum thalictroides TaxID=46969 RepID=A0A7J6WID6_THATH|nr:hypothetical protein FRX31_014041 [Thalictrum thalictroides]